MSQLFAFEITGSAADGQSWTTRGTVTLRDADVPDMVHAAMGETFLQLTQGKAVYGKPGLACRGPYKITKLLFSIIPN
jgi:hypothetical protein